MYRGSKFKSVLKVTLLAFLINAIMPFFAVYDLASNNAQAKELASIFGDKVFICTSDGFKWVSLEDIQNGKDLPKEHPKYECALCLISNKNDKNFIPPELAFVSEASYEVMHQLLIESDAVCNQQFKFTSPSRAPPFIS